MVVDDGGDPRHEGQACRHVQVQVEGLGEPGRTHTGQKGFNTHTDAHKHTHIPIG